MLHEPDRRLVKGQRLTFLGFSVLAFGAGVALAALSFYAVPTDFSATVEVNVYFAVTFLAIGVWLGALCLMWALRYRPTRVHSRGIAVAQRWGGDLFIPWGLLEGRPGELDFKGPQDERAGFDASIPNADAVKAIAEERMGDGGYGSEEYGRGITTILCRSIVFTTTVAFFSCVILAVPLFVMPVVVGKGVALAMSAILLLTIFMFFYLGGVGFLGNWAWQRHIAPDDRRPVHTFMVVVLVLVTSLAFSVALIEDVEPHFEIGGFGQELDPEWTVVEPGKYVDEVLEANGTVRVGPGQDLTLINSTLKFGSYRDGDVGIWVGEGGSLMLINTKVTAPSISQGYYIEIYGSALISGCDLQHLWGRWWNWDEDGGVEVYSDDVRIVNTTIRDCNTNGIMVARSSPEIVNCTLYNIQDDAIEVQGGSPLIRGCNISWCTSGVWLFGSTGVVEDTLFGYNSRGIFQEWSHADVLNCSFFGQSHQAILVTVGFEGRMEGNTFEGNGVDIETTHWGVTSPLTGVGVWMWDNCVAIGAAMAILGSALCLLQVRRMSRKLDDLQGKEGRKTEEPLEQGEG